MKNFVFVLLAFLLLSCTGKPSEPRVQISTSMGDIVVRLYNETPLHRDNFLRLADTGALDSTMFHRVIRDFMIQGGDPDSRGAEPGVQLGEGEVGEKLPAEFRTPEIVHKRGSLAAAREGDSVNPDKMSSGSQFYICWDNVSHLDGSYTVFGEVETGLEVVEAIQNVMTDDNDRPIDDVVLISLKVLAP